MKKVLALVLSIFVIFTLNSDDLWARKNPLAKWKTSVDMSGARYTMKVSNISHPIIEGVAVGYHIRDALWEQSNGQIALKYYPLHQLGDEVKVLNMLKSNTVQGMLCSSIAATDLAPRMGVVNLPFLINSFAKIETFVNSGDLWQIFLDGMQQHGIMGLDITSYGNYGWATKKVVTKIRDAKNIKFRIAEAAVQRTIYKEWGLHPVVMPWPDVAISLKQGVITGLDHTPMVCNITRKFDICKNFTQVNYAQGLFVFLINQHWFNNLPSNLQEVLTRVVHDECAKSRRAARRQEEEQITKAKNAGVRFHTLSINDMQWLKEKADTAHREWENKIGSDYLKRVQDYMGYNPSDNENNYIAQRKAPQPPPKTLTSYKKAAQDTTPPKIELDSNNHQTTTRNKITISGKVRDRNGVVNITVDNQSAYMDYNGNFSADIFLALGNNIVQIEAMDRNKNVAKKTITITRQALQPPPAHNYQTLTQTPKKQNYNKIALLLGNENYFHGGKLKNPVNDAKALQTALKNLGFETIIHKNCEQNTMKRAIDEFGRKLKKFDVGLFFYAGHGVQVRGKNYLVPIDARMENENDIEYECVRADRILAKMDNAQTKVNIVILDACRNNPFARSWHRGGQDQGLAFMNAPSGSIIAYATSPGQTASDGDENHGIYTSAILQHLNTPGITIEEFFKKVRLTVRKKSSGHQTPWESTSLTGKFIFKIK